MQTVRKFSVSLKSQLEGMLKVDTDYETRSRSSIASMLEDLVQLRRSFLRKQSDAVSRTVGVRPTLTMRRGPGGSLTFEDNQVNFLARTDGRTAGRRTGVYRISSTGIWPVGLKWPICGVQAFYFTQHTKTATCGYWNSLANRSAKPRKWYPMNIKLFTAYQAKVYGIKE